MMDDNEFSPPLDPMLPDLESAVRPGALRPEFQSAFRRIVGNSDPTIKRITVEFFHHKPLTNCRIVYRVLFKGGRELMVCGKIHPRLEKRSHSSGAKSTFLPAFNMTLRILPDDADLPGLKQAMDPAWVADHQDRFLLPHERESHKFNQGDVRIRVLNYRPRSRCLLQIETKHIGACGKRRLTHYVKVYHRFPSHDWPESLLSLYDIRTPAPLALPTLTGISHASRIIVFRAISGHSFSRIMEGQDFLKWIKRTSVALAGFHAMKTKFSVCRSLQDELRELESCVFSLHKIDPGLGEPASALYRMLYSRSFDLSNIRTRIIHGDFSHEQLLFRKNKILILDSDHLSMGDYRLDLGNFAANLLELSAAGRMEESRSEAALKAFFSSCRDLYAEDWHPGSIRWYTAASLLKLAMRPLRRGESGWEVRVEKILRRAAGIISRDNGLFHSLEKNRSAGCGVSRAKSEPQAKHPGGIRIEYLLSSRHPVDTLRKVWPEKEGVWMLLFSPAGEGSKNRPGFLKIDRHGAVKFRELSQDSKLISSRIAFKPDRMKKLLAPLEFLPSDFSLISSLVRGYKPEKRCQVEYILKTPGISENRMSVFVKFLHDSESARILSGHIQELADLIAGEKSGPLTPPRGTGLLPQINAVVLAGMGEVSFYDRLKRFRRKDASCSESEPIENDIEIITAGLKQFHGLSLVPERIYSWRDEIQTVDRWTRAVERLFPSLEWIFHGLRDRLQSMGEKTAGGKSTLIHRDFYDKQIILCGDRVSFLDYDLLAFGSPALDLGNFAAHLILRGIQLRADASSFKPLIRRLMTEYQGGKSQAPPPGIDFYTASALLRLSAVYLLRPGGRRYFRMLVEECRRNLFL